MSTSVRLAEIDFAVLPLNERSLLLRPRQPPEDALALPRIGQQIQDHALPALEEVIATTTELCLVAAGDEEDLLRQVAQLDLRTANVPGRRITLPACFDLDDSDDWQDVSRQTGLDRDTYVDRLCRTDLQLAMIGFLPGFVYLAGLPNELRCRRKADPTVRVPAGSVAVGGPYAGVYGLASPAGWQVIGRTPVRLADPGRNPPLSLRIGDHLRLRALPLDELERLAADPPDVEALLARPGDD